MIIFKNPGLIDLRSTSTMGLNAKPNTNKPIGYFGTGLKYAISVILREGGVMKIYRGKSVHTFTIGQRMFRGTRVKVILLDGKELPFTLEFGKNWKPWQAFRELYSNTLDEGGEIYHSDEPVKGETGYTTITVDGADFDALFEHKSSVFLETKPIAVSNGVEIHPGPSSCIYYNGMRAMDLKNQSDFAYNITTHMALTEDRTFMYAFSAGMAVVKSIAACKDTRIIAKALDKGNESWESSLDYSDVHSGAVSKEFMDVAGDKRANNTLRQGSATKLFQQEAVASKEYIGHITRNPTVVENDAFNNAIHRIRTKVHNFPDFGLMVSNDDEGVRRRGNVLIASQNAFNNDEFEIAAMIISEVALTSKTDYKGHEFLARLILDPVLREDEQIAEVVIDREVPKPAIMF